MADTTTVPPARLEGSATPVRTRTRYLSVIRAVLRRDLAELAADLADPSRVRRVDGDRWRRVDPPPGAPNRHYGWKELR